MHSYVLLAPSSVSLRDAHTDPADPGDPPDLVHGLQLGTSPTRAGSQDDVSLNKLPQMMVMHDDHAL